MVNIVISAKDLRKTYTDGIQDLKVLKGIDLEISEGETVALMGPSGAGKSTLLHILGLMDSASSGELEVLNKNANHLTPEDKDHLRNQKIGFLFQFHYLLPGLTILENASLPLRIGGMSVSEAQKKTAEILSFVGLSERLHHLPSRVSGGEQQRAALARAMASHPRFLICDEPTGNLDLERGEEIREIIWKMARQEGTAVLLATHNPDLAKLATRTLRMTDGRIQNK